MRPVCFPASAHFAQFGLCGAKNARRRRIIFRLRVAANSARAQRAPGARRQARFACSAAENAIRFSDACNAGLARGAAACGATAASRKKIKPTC